MTGGCSVLSVDLRNVFVWCHGVREAVLLFSGDAAARAQGGVLVERRDDTHGRCG